LEGGPVGHNFERDPPRDHPCQVWFNLVQRFQRRRFKTSITGFFMNFELWPILTDYANRKKSSPLKLLSHSQPNFAEMILGWLPFKNHCSKFIKNPVILVKKLIIMLIQLKFGHILA
jgi:hypothetical protein